MNIVSLLKFQLYTQNMLCTIKKLYFTIRFAYDIRIRIYENEKKN